jgi:hypothetical protein
MKQQPKVEHPYKGGRKWALMAIDDIESGDNPGHVYLRRWRLFQCPRFAIYVHQIWEADTQGGQEVRPHNHPANFWLLILKGGYLEYLYPWPRHSPHIRYAKVHSTGSWRRMGTIEAHYISKLLRVPSWSLVFVGRRNPTWYFFDEQGQAIDWREFNRVRDINQG